MKKTFRLFFAVTAIIGLIFLSCEGAMGPQGDQGSAWTPDPGGPLAPPVEVVVRVDLDDVEIVVPVGRPTIIIPVVYPNTAVVQTLVWELYGDSGDTIRLARPTAEPTYEPGPGFPLLTGRSVMVVGRQEGEGVLTVTAFGGGGDLIETVITVKVESFPTRMERALANFQGTSLSLTVYANEQIQPANNLNFGGNNVNINLVGAVRGVTLGLSEPGHMFIVGNNVRLTLDNVILRGISANTGGALVLVAPLGTLEMEEGSGITGNLNTSAEANNTPGGGVLNFGTFIMRGGTISGNRAGWGGPFGGGVLNMGTFQMMNGSIIGNMSNSFGGGVHNQGTFHMFDGLISGNEATNMGGGVSSTLEDSSFVMDGGVISMNRVYTPLVQNRQAGGVFVGHDTTFVMYDGQIIGNIGGFGGGVRVRSGGTFTMHNGEISGNNSFHGGGVDNSGIFTVFNGTISDNEAEVNANSPGSGTGGGVHNHAESGGIQPVFVMHNGEIFGNTALNGAGVENRAGTFQIVNGVLYGNDVSLPEERRNVSFDIAGNSTVRSWGTASSQRGRFVAGEFISDGNLPNTGITLAIDNGALLIPDRVGDIVQQLDWLRLFAQSEGSYTVDITESTHVTVPQTLLPAGRTDLTITVRGVGAGHEISLLSGTLHHIAMSGNIFTVGSGVTLILENLTLVGRSVGPTTSYHNSHSLVRVTSGGTFIMNTGSAVTGNANSTGTLAQGGGGVRVENEGVFILNGGEIFGNSTSNAGAAGNGGGVRVETGGRFEMLDGAIFGNTGHAGGGVFVNTGATFLVSDGTIYGFDYPVAARRNFSRVSGGTALLNSGTAEHGRFITEGFDTVGSLTSTDFTVFVDDGDYLPPGIAGDLIAQLAWVRSNEVNNDTIIIPVTADIDITPAQSVLPTGRTGLTIIIRGVGAQHEVRTTNENGLLFGDGGAVAATGIPAGITLVLENITIVGRTNGVGVHTAHNNQPLIRVLNGATLRLNDDSLLTGNTNNATLVGNQSGGGVFVLNGGRLIMDGGEISGNATSGAGTGATSPGHGGGVRVAAGGTLDMIHGTIAGNLGAGGGGVFNIGTVRIQNGVIYGVDEANVTRRNESGISTSASLHNADHGIVVNPSGTVLLGSFDNDDVFAPNGVTVTSSDLTVRVVGGVQTPPTRVGNLSAQLAWLRTFAQDGGTYAVYIHEDEEIAPSFLQAPVFNSLPTGRTDVTVILRGDGAMRTLTVSGNGAHFIVPTGVTLLLDFNLTLEGRVQPVSGSHPIIRVNNGANFIMNDTVRIVDNFNPNTARPNGGGGVRVMNGGVFVMNGGEISGNIAAHNPGSWDTPQLRDPGLGSGVVVSSGGRFDMRGGRIFANEAAIGGGVFVAPPETVGADTFPAGIFRISNGVIYGSDAAPALANRSRIFGHAAFENRGTAHRGTFSGDVFNPTELLSSSDRTMTVTNGSLNIAPMPRGTFVQELLYLRENAQDDGEYTITVSGNHTLTPDQALFPTLPVGRDNITITLTGNGTISLVDTAGTGVSLQGVLFNVPAGMTLILEEGVTLEGRDVIGGAANQQNNNPVVRVDGGTLRMYSNATITANNNTSTIAGNLGAAVRVNDGGLFVLNGGEISGIRGGAGGAVHIAEGGTFDMLSGVIENNTFTGTASGGVNVTGLSTNLGTFNMSGGYIRNNNVATGAGGVRVIEGGVFNFLDGEIYGHTVTGGTSAGGIFISGAPANRGLVNMTGGVIRNNNITGLTAGGAVQIAAGGTFNMHPGSDIRNNTVTNTNSAGAVQISSAAATNQGIFNMFGGTISGNTSINVTNTGAAGAVRLAANAGSVFNMRGGSISGNRVDSLSTTAAGASSGAVLVLNNGVFRISDGTIYGEDEVDESLRNRAMAENRAFGWDTLFGAATVATNRPQRGTFAGDVFTPNPSDAALPNSDGTIRVVNGN